MGSIHAVRRPIGRRHLCIATIAVFVTFLSLLASPNGAQAQSERLVAAGDYLCNGAAATIVGTAGDDVLVGTDHHDVIVGRGGDDTIIAGRGDDFVCGGGGDDILRGGRGDDWLDGESGYDKLVGGAGDDMANDPDAKCKTEQFEGCRELLPAGELPKCGDAPLVVVQAIYASFHDTPHVCHFAEYIAFRESRWTPDIIGGPNRNGSYDYGLLQLNSGYIRTWAEWAGVDWNDWDDPFVNAQIARALYDRAGEMWGDPLRPWAVRR